MAPSHTLNLMHKALLMKRLAKFGASESWAQKPVWMLNVLRFKGGEDASSVAEAASHYDRYGEKMVREVFPAMGARVVLSGTARTVVGSVPFHKVAIVEYESPESFLEMLTDGSQAAHNETREAALEEQLLIPMRAGWYAIDRPAPTPTWVVDPPTSDPASTPSGLSGEYSSLPEARVADEGPEGLGPTASTAEQTTSFATDRRFDDGPLWHLNLLNFREGDSGEPAYVQNYARHLGGRDGLLSKVGGRSTLATECRESLLGAEHFHQAIVAEYPSRDSYFAMAASDEYRRVAKGRHDALKRTYIISVKPEYVDRRGPGDAA